MRCRGRRHRRSATGSIPFAHRRPHSRAALHRGPDPGVRDQPHGVEAPPPPSACRGRSPSESGEASRSVALTKPGHAVSRRSIRSTSSASIASCRFSESGIPTTGRHHAWPTRVACRAIDREECLAPAQASGVPSRRAQRSGRELRPRSTTPQWKRVSGRAARSRGYAPAGSRRRPGPRAARAGRPGSFASAPRRPAGVGCRVAARWNRPSVG